MCNGMTLPPSPVPFGMVTTPTHWLSADAFSCSTLKHSHSKKRLIWPQHQLTNMTNSRYNSICYPSSNMQHAVLEYLSELNYVINGLSQSEFQDKARTARWTWGAQWTSNRRSIYNSYNSERRMRTIREHLFVNCWWWMAHDHETTTSKRQNTTYLRLKYDNPHAVEHQLNTIWHSGNSKYYQAIICCELWTNWSDTSSKWGNKTTRCRQSTPADRQRHH